MRWSEVTEMADKESRESNENSPPSASEKFLKITEAHPPTRRTAKNVFFKYVEVLRSLDEEGWKRFFDLQRQENSQ